MPNNQETLLRVEHLCQYFPMEGGELKAVDDVSFEIQKGEVFGLVGESGCGKNDNGTLHHQLYDITSGKCVFQRDSDCGWNTILCGCDQSCEKRI